LGGLGSGGAEQDHLYPGGAGKDVWEKAEKLAGGSVSALITEALRRYVEVEERSEQTGMENIEVELPGRLP